MVGNAAAAGIIATEGYHSLGTQKKAAVFAHGGEMQLSELKQCNDTTVSKFTTNVKRSRRSKHMISTADLTAKLEGVRRRNGGFIAKCPAHEDSNPSLSVSTGDDGRVLVNCFAGCSAEAVVRAAGFDMRDLLPDRPHTNGNGNGTGKRVVAAYDYRNADGDLAFQKLRYEPKGFSQRQPDGKGGWIYKLTGVELVPYRLPELLAARANGIDEILLVEGEKDADALRSLGLTATSFRGWSKTFNEHLKGLRCVLLVDHDSAGRKYAAEAAAILSEDAENLKIIDLFDGEPENGQDVSDWIDARRSEGRDEDEIADELCRVIESAEIVGIPGIYIGNTQNTQNFPLTLTTLDDLLAEPKIENSYVWNDTFIDGGFSIVSGKPKSGKSTFIRNLCVAIANGKPFLGRTTRPGRIIYLCLEEKRDQIADHFRRLGATGLDILIFTGTLPTPESVAIQNAIEAEKPSLVVIDPMSRVIRAADFNAYGEMARAMEPLINAARATNCHITCLHHDSKMERTGGDALLGSTAIFGAVDCHIQIRKRENARTALSTQRYGVDLEETVIELDMLSGVVSGCGELREHLLRKCKAEILEILPGDGFTAAEIKEAVTGFDNGTVSKAIKALVDENYIEKFGAGRKGDPRIYKKPSYLEKPIDF